MRKTYTIKSKLMVSVVVALTTIVLGGCAGMPWSNESASTGVAASEFESQTAELTRREADLNKQAEELKAEKMALEAERNEMQTDAEATRTSGNADRVADFEPGECYARVIIPARYKIVATNRETRQESDSVKVIPARYEPGTQRVLVKEAATRFEVEEAQFERVRKQIMVEPPRIKLKPIEPEYETRMVEVLIKPEIIILEPVAAKYKTIEEELVIPARTEWRLVKDPGSLVSLASDSATQRYGRFEVLQTRVHESGELMCLVLIPEKKIMVTKDVVVEPATTRVVKIEKAEYQTVAKEFLIKPATVEEIPIPARYETIEVTRLVRPDTPREEPIPAAYRTVTVTTLEEPGDEIRTLIPAAYTQDTRSELISDPRNVTQPVFCEFNTTPADVKEFQKALNKENSSRVPAFRTCEEDGLWGPCTLDAAMHFATQHTLPWGSNYITMDVKNALGVKLSSDQ